MFAEGYRCDRCRADFDLRAPLNTCPRCDALLEIQYATARMSSCIQRGAVSAERGMWRWRQFLPLPAAAEAVSLGEGDTPLVPSIFAGPQLGLRRLYFKNDTLMPTGSFKDRGFSLAVSFARSLGVAEGLTYSSGNAGASFAAYAARAGMHALVLVEYVANAVKQASIQLLGATTVVLDFESMEDITSMLSEAVQTEGLYQFVNFINPVRHEAMKTYAYEICESLEWQAPGVEVHPVGTGGGLWGAWKGYRELAEMGWIERLPRMVAVQPAASAHMLEAFKTHSARAERFGDSTATIAQSIAADAPIQGGERVLRAMYDSAGWAEGVTDEEILEAMRWLGREGIAAEPAAAAPLAAVRRAVEAGMIQPDETVVCVVTGSALKQPAAILQAAGEPDWRIRADATELRDLLARWRGSRV
jgi:threonine synthase